MIPPALTRQTPVVRGTVRATLVITAVTAAVVAAWRLATGDAGDAAWIAIWTLAGGGASAALVWAARDLLTAPDGRALARPGLANLLTLLRFVLAAPVVVLVVAGRYADACILYAVLVWTDVADGIVARARAQASVFGVFMDPLADVLSTFAVFAALAIDGLVPHWLLALLAVRYLMLGLGSWWLASAAGRITFRATVPGKVVGVVQAAGAVAILAGAATGGLHPAISSPLFSFLGLGFASIVVSQAVIGWRHLGRKRI